MSGCMKMGKGCKPSVMAFTVHPCSETQCLPPGSLLSNMKMEQRYRACQMLTLEGQAPTSPNTSTPLLLSTVSERQRAWHSPDSPSDKVHPAPGLRVHSSSSRAPSGREIVRCNANLRAPPSLATLCCWKGETDGDPAH